MIAKRKPSPLVMIPKEGFKPDHIPNYDHNFDWSALGLPPNSAFRDCPEAGLRWEFNAYKDRETNEHMADLYMQISLHTWFSFREVLAMQMFLYNGPEAFDIVMDGKKPATVWDYTHSEEIPTIVAQIVEEEERDTELMRGCKLPLRELLEIFCRAQARAKRFADLFPKRRKAILAEIEDNAQKLMEMVYRHRQEQLPKDN
jgi:hypothetical protein